MLTPSYAGYFMYGLVLSSCYVVYLFNHAPRPPPRRRPPAGCYPGIRHATKYSRSNVAGKCRQFTTARISLPITEKTLYRYHDSVPGLPVSAKLFLFHFSFRSPQLWHPQRYIQVRTTFICFSMCLTRNSTCFANFRQLITKAHARARTSLWSDHRPLNEIIMG